MDYGFPISDYWDIWRSVNTTPPLSTLSWWLCLTLQDSWFVSCEFNPRSWIISDQFPAIYIIYDLIICLYGTIAGSLAAEYLCARYNFLELESLIILLKMNFSMVYNMLVVWAMIIIMVCRLLLQEYFFLWWLSTDWFVQYQCWRYLRMIFYFLLKFYFHLMLPLSASSP